MDRLRSKLISPIAWRLSSGMRCLSGDRGAVSTEYGLLLVLIALVLIAAMITFGIAVSDMIQTGADSVPPPP